MAVEKTNSFKVNMINDLEKVYNEILGGKNYFTQTTSLKGNLETIVYRKTNTYLNLYDYVFFENSVSDRLNSLIVTTTQSIETINKIKKDTKSNYESEIESNTQNALKVLKEINELFYLINSHLDSYINYYSTDNLEKLNKNSESNLTSEKLKIEKITQNILEKLNDANKFLVNIKSICINLVTGEAQREEVFKQEYIARFNEEKSLLIKQFEVELSNLKEKYDNSFKSHNLELEGLNKSTDLLRKSLDNSMTTQTQLLGRIQKIELEFFDIIKDKTDIIEQELEIAKTALSTEINSIKQTLYLEEKTIKDAHKDFITLVQSTGIHKLTENYKKKSEDEEQEYKDYRKFTSWAIMGAIGSTFIILIGAWIQQLITDIDTNYLFLAARLTLSLMFFVLAFYLSKQAAKHYECFQENHRTFLQLAALEPFMARMNDDEKKAIRKELISTYFNQNADGKFASKGDEVSWLDVKSYLEKIPEFGKSNPATSNNEPTKPTNG